MVTRPLQFKLFSDLLKKKNPASFPFSALLSFYPPAPLDSRAASFIQVWLLPPQCSGWWGQGSSGQRQWQQGKQSRMDSWTQWELRSGPRYMICVTLFFHVAAVARIKKNTDMRESHAKRVQKTHGHARIARVSRAILTCRCVFWLAQRAKTCDKIWYLWPLLSGNNGWWICNGISDSATAGDAWPLLDSFLLTSLIHLEGIAALQLLRDRRNLWNDEAWDPNHWLEQWWASYSRA